MRKLRTTILAGAGALLAAGAAQAATGEVHRMNVALPDGSVARIEYTGDIAPKVTIQPAEARTVLAFDPFAGFERIMTEMQARHSAMMRQMAALERAVIEAETGVPGQLTLVGNLPAGVHYSYVSSTIDASGCTRTVEYRSDGSGAAPKVTHASTGNCDAVQRDPAPLPVSADVAPSPRAEAGQV